MYEITIIKKEMVSIKKGKNWKVVDQRPITQEEVNKGFGDNSTYEGKLSDVYGYTPEIEKEEEIETKVLMQVVEDLDLVKVINAVNGIEK